MRHLVQISLAASLMFLKNRSDSAGISFLFFFILTVFLSVGGGFTGRPALVVVTLFHVFSEGNPPPPLLTSPSFTLPYSAPSRSAFTAATDVKTCLRQCSLLRQKAFFHLDHNGIIRLREIPCLRGF